MEIKNERMVPFMAVPPGAILKEELRERGIKQKDFAKTIGMSPSHLSELIKGKIRITSQIADKLEEGLNIPSIHWTNGQANYEYDLKVIAQRKADKAKEKKRRKQSAVPAGLSLSIATKIADLLNERSMTRQELAKKTGNRERDVAKWLGGNFDFTLSTLSKISDALGYKLIEVR